MKEGGAKLLRPGGRAAAVLNYAGEYCEYAEYCDELQVIRSSGAAAKFCLQRLPVARSKWCTDTSDPGHFGPETFRHRQTGAEVSRQIGTSAEVSLGHFGTNTELSHYI